MVYDEIISKNQAFIDETYEKLDKKLSRTAIKSRDKIPYTVKADGEHDDRHERYDIWTNGFWGGLMWLMYHATGNEEYKITARRAGELMDKAFTDVDCLHHDVGFMWHITAGADYRLTGDRTARNKNLICAMTLASRFKTNGGYIRAWNENWGGESNDGWTIIDTLMNIPLLFWASKELGDDRFSRIAVSHAQVTLRDHLRADGSINHIVIHDLQTGEPVGVKAGQGYSPESCWSRGEAWALYGFYLAYLHTNDKKYLDAAKGVAHYCIACLQYSDFMPLVDFRAPEEPVYYDSTAGAIIACGLIEIAKAVPEHEKKLYLTSAIKLLKNIEKNFCNWEDDFDAIVTNGTEMYSNADRPLPIIYGDYYFTEAILKLKGSDFMPW